MQTDLTSYDNSWYKPGPKFKRALWYAVNIIIFKTPLFPFSLVKRSILRVFGSKIGKRVVIKPGVNIKYPWNLKIGDNTWIGEGVWIDNLAQVTIGKNACLSQGCFILCGNHDFSKSSFDLMLSSITLEDGVWIGAKSVVKPGTYAKSHSVLTLNSVSPKLMEEYGIYQGNPAQIIKKRIITE